MKKSTAVILIAGAFLIPGAARAAQGPELDLTAKKELTDRTASAPVTAPLSVGTAFNASLLDAIDTRRARPGDLVNAEVVENVSYERSVIFPKGTKVTGHVVRASSGGHGRTGSALFVQFDKAILKDGEEVVLNAGIQALAVSSVPALSDTDAGKAGAGSQEANVSTGESVELGAQTTSTASGNDALIVSTIYETPRSGVRAPLFAAPAAEGQLDTDGMFTPDSKGAFGRPDLKVYTPTSEGSHGTVLLSSRKHMRLENGTRLLLVVQPPPSAELDAMQSIDLDDSNPNQ
jgi:hypothetical protein